MTSGFSRTRRAQNRAGPTVKDLELLLATMSAAATALGSEQFEADEDAYLNEVIAKPWGFEYRIYADTFYDVWALRLRPGQSTSTHCHPRKDTALLCLAGEGETHFLDEAHSLRELDIVDIPRAVFHSTENTGDSVLDLVEIELPRNKLDLVRSEDSYGRAGGRYETETRHDVVVPMSPANLVAHSRMRRHSLTGEHRFRVECGAEAARRVDGGGLFAVSLGLENAVSNEIEVVPLAGSEAAALDPDATYFTISHQP